MAGSCIEAREQGRPADHPFPLEREGEEGGSDRSGPN
jgi:hypothetical protein